RGLLEDFRPRERHQDVLAAARDSQFFMEGIDGNAGWRNTRHLCNGDLPPWRSVTAVVDAPGTDTATRGAADDPSLWRIAQQDGDSAKTDLGPFDDAQGLGISGRGPVKDQQCATLSSPALGRGADEEEVVDGIDTDNRVAALRAVN